MNITVLSHSSELGGAELALLSLVNNSPEINWKIIFPSKGPLINKFNKIDYAIIPLPWWCKEKNDNYTLVNKIKIENDYKKLKQEISSSDFALTNTITTPWLSFAAAELKIPHLWYIHEFGDIDHRLDFLCTVKGVASIVSRNSNIVLTISDSLKQHLIKNGCKKNQVKIIRQNADPKRFELLKTISPSELSPTLNLLILGAIKPSKGQDVALDAISRLIKEKYDCKLRIRGPIADVTYANSIIQKAKEYYPNITIETGFFDPYDLYKSSQIVLICSKNEALGRITLEALASGRIVIGNDSASTHELLANNRGILYFRTAELLTKEILKVIDGKMPDVKKARKFVIENFNKKTEHEDFKKALTNKIVENNNYCLRDYLKLLEEKGLIVNNFEFKKIQLKKQVITKSPRAIRKVYRIFRKR